MPNSLSDDYRVREPPKAVLPASRRSPPTPARRMPFRPENVRTTVLVLAIVFVTLIGVVAAAVVSVWGHEQSTPVQISVGGLAFLAVTQLLGILRHEYTIAEAAKKADVAAEKAGEAAAEVKTAHTAIKAVAQDTNQKVAELAKHTNGELTSAIKEAGEQARQGERDQVLPAVLPELVQNPDFRRLLEEVAEAAFKKYCGK